MEQNIRFGLVGSTEKNVCCCNGGNSLCDFYKRTLTGQFALLIIEIQNLNHVLPLFIISFKVTYIAM